MGRDVRVQLAGATKGGVKENFAKAIDLGNPVQLISANRSGISYEFTN